MNGKRLSKTQLVEAMAQQSGLSKKQATSALEALNATVADQLGRRGPGEVIIPGLVRLAVTEKPATPAREGVNPFTKERMMFKAKPARKVIKVRPLKALKDGI